MKKKYYYNKFLSFKVLDVKTRQPINNAVISLDGTVIQNKIIFPYSISTAFNIKVDAEGYNSYEGQYTYYSLNNGEILLSKIQNTDEVNINLTWDPITETYDLDLHLYIFNTSDNSEQGHVWFSAKDVSIADSSGTSYKYTLDYDDDTGQDSIPGAHTENISGVLVGDYYYKVKVHDFKNKQNVKVQNPKITITYNNIASVYNCVTDDLECWEVLTIKKNPETGVWEFIPTENTIKISN